VSRLQIHAGLAASQGHSQSRGSQRERSSAAYDVAARGCGAGGGSTQVCPNEGAVTVGSVPTGGSIVNAGGAIDKMSSRDLG
jgi:hypothetical protein